MQKSRFAIKQGTSGVLWLRTGIDALKAAVRPVMLIVAIFVAYTVALAAIYFGFGRPDAVMVIGAVIVPPIAGTTYVFWDSYKRAVKNRRRIIDLTAPDLLAIVVTAVAVYLETAGELREEAGWGRIFALIFMVGFLLAGFVIIVNFDARSIPNPTHSWPRPLSWLSSLAAWLLRPLFTSLAHVVSFYVAGTAIFFLTLHSSPWTLWVCLIVALVLMAAWDFLRRRRGAADQDLLRTQE